MNPSPTQHKLSAVCVENKFAYMHKAECDPKNPTFLPFAIKVADSCDKSSALCMAQW